jgi:hypothetical protein
MMIHIRRVASYCQYMAKLELEALMGISKLAVLNVFSDNPIIIPAPATAVTAVLPPAAAFSVVANKKLGNARLHNTSIQFVFFFK